MYLLLFAIVSLVCWVTRLAKVYSSRYVVGITRDPQHRFTNRNYGYKWSSKGGIALVVLMEAANVFQDSCVLV